VRPQRPAHPAAPPLASPGLSVRLLGAAASFDLGGRAETDERDLTLVAGAADEHDGALVPVDSPRSPPGRARSALGGFLVRRLGYRRDELFPNG
jgi:hypothetical protein